MNKIVVISVVSASLFAVTACQTQQRTGILFGSAAGALVGGALGSGSGRGLAIVGGAIVGGLLGGAIGKSMDNQDKILMNQSLSQTPVGQESRWRNPNNGYQYEVRPVRNYHKHNRYCREYQTKVTVNGKQQSAYGRACRQPDGSWKIVS